MEHSTPHVHAINTGKKETKKRAQAQAQKYMKYFQEAIITLTFVLSSSFRCFRCVCSSYCIFQVFHVCYGKSENFFYCSFSGQKLSENVCSGGTVNFSSSSLFWLSSSSSSSIWKSVCKKRNGMDQNLSAFAKFDNFFDTQYPI